MLPYHICISGTYGTVFKAKNKETQEIVALKRVRLDDDDEVSSISIFLGVFPSMLLLGICLLDSKVKHWILKSIDCLLLGCSFIGVKRDMSAKGTKAP